MKLLTHFFLLLYIGTAATYPLDYAQSYASLESACSLNISSSSNYTKAPAPTIEKEWTFMVYMAADNDLKSFAIRNLRQMAAIGSTEWINIVVHLDIRDGSNKKITRRFYVKKNELVTVIDDSLKTVWMDSGNPETLISFVKTAVEQFPAKNYAFIAWDHGSGDVDTNGKIINPTNLFVFNPLINKLELDRSLGFLDLIDMATNDIRGICWDDTTGNYLTNQKFEHALDVIFTTILKGKKLSMLGFDACLMSGIGIASIAKKYAHLMIGSEEVELGMGWPYCEVLAPFEHGSLSKEEFAMHIVEVYGKAYANITNDYTQSAITLKHISELEESINHLSILLIEGLKTEVQGSVKKSHH